MKLSYIIVNYNVTEYLRNCLHSIVKYTDILDYEVIVIDNQSADSSWKMLQQEFPEVIFIENPKNEGFSKANNKAVELSKAEYLFFLNPDTEIKSYCIKEILEFADSQRMFGALGLRMHNLSGEFLPESKRSVPSAISSFEKLFLNFKTNEKKSYYRTDISENAISEVEILTGANLLIKKLVYKEIGGFDERYFMYGEDIDLCYSLLQNSYKNFYYGKFSILHHKGMSTEKDMKYINRFYGAMQIFIDKYYKNKKPIQYIILKFGLIIKREIEYLKLKKKRLHI